MAAHRYWRVRFLSPSTPSDPIALAEVEMMTVSGGADQCSGGSASASTGTAANAFDNNTGTSCTLSAADTTRTIGYDFGAGNDKDIVEYTLRSVGGVSAAWVLEYSDNNSSWTVADRRSYLLVNATTTTFSVEFPTYNTIQAGLTSVAPVLAVSWAGANPSVRSADRAVINFIVPSWEYVGGGNFPVPVNGIITGAVTEGGVPIPYARVYCYFRASGILIATANCDASGNFTFYGLDPTPPADPDDGKYFVVAFDPAGGTRYNALIYDRVVPS